MTQNFIKIYMGNDLAFINIDNDIIVGRSHLSNRVELITPVTLGTDDVMQIYFELANGQTTPKRSMIVTGATETVGNDQWNVYRYDIPQSVLSAITSFQASTIKVQFRKATIGTGEGNPVDDGTATSATSTTLVDSTQTWTTNQYENFIVYILSGTGAGQKRTIASNTATTLTVSTAWTVTPNTTSTYNIRPITTIAQALIASAQVTLTLDASVIPNLEDEVIEIDVFDELAGLINNKLNKNFSDFTIKNTPDDTDLIAIDEGAGTNKKVTVGKIVTIAVDRVDGLIARLEQVENFVDQDVSIGSNPHFAEVTVDELTFRDNGNTATIDYADALAINATQAHIDDTTIHFLKTDVTKTDVGLGNVDNTSDLNKPISTATQTALDGKANVSHTHTVSQITDIGTNFYNKTETDTLLTGKVNTSLLGANNGVATLDAGGKVPAQQLPSFVDDLEEYANLAAFPVTGDSDKIYVALDTNKIYRWSGSIYVEIAANEVNSVNSKTGVVTLVAGDIGVTTTGYSGFLLTTDDTVQKVADKVAALDASKVGVDTTGFNGYLATTDDTVQKIATKLSTLDAPDIATVTTSFNKLLATADNTIQKALDTLDDHVHTEADITDLDKYTQTQIDGFLADKVNVADLSSTIILYPTTTASDISTYFRLVDSITDTDYDSPAVDVPTGVISGQNTLLSSLAADPALFLGNPGVINITVLGKIRKTAGGTTQGAKFYYEVYLRNAGGTETLLATSDETRTVTSNTYEEFFASALLNNGDFTATDRIVYKFYGNNVGGGSPEFDFEFGGTTPVRALLPLPVNVTLQASKVFYDNTGQNLVATNVQDAINEIDDLVEEGLTQVVITKYTITQADNGSGGFTYNRNDETGITGTKDGSKFVFVLPTGIEYVTGANRLETKIDDSTGALRRLFYGPDAELTEPSDTTFALEFALADNDVVYSKIYQSLATVSLDIADGSITQGKIADGAVTTNKIANNAVDLTKVQQIATLTILGNDTGSTANVKALTVSETKTMLALNNVDNTSDLNKPISSNTQTALDAKVTGPASAVNNQVATFDGTTGKLIKDSGFTIETSVPSGALFTDTVFTHPTDGANTTITAANGLVLSAITVNNLGHTTSVSSKTLAEVDIPDLAISKITNLQTTLDGKDANVIEVVQAEGTPLTVTTKTVNVTRASLGAANVAYYTTTVVGSDGTSNWVEQTTGDWEDAYIATKTVTGIAATDRPLIDLDLSGATFLTYEALQTDYALIFRVEASGTNEIKFYASEEPVEDLVIQIKVVK